MFLKLEHQNLLVTQRAKILVEEIYKLAMSFPAHEKYAMISQIRRAALSVYLNIAEGCSRNSTKERTRFFEIARGSITEIDAVLDIAEVLGYLRHIDLAGAEKALPDCYKLLSLLIRSTK
jgi:four helix bundle protein